MELVVQAGSQALGAWVSPGGEQGAAEGLESRGFSLGVRFSNAALDRRQGRVGDRELPGGPWMIQGLERDPLEYRGGNGVGKKRKERETCPILVGLGDHQDEEKVEVIGVLVS